MKAKLKLTKKEKQKIKSTCVEICKAITYIGITLATAFLCGCGVTKASINNKASGTTTTITITTSNPMTTQVNPNTNLEAKKGE